jgi:hypothetical protein
MPDYCPIPNCTEIPRGKIDVLLNNYSHNLCIYLWQNSEYFGLSHSGHKTYSYYAS